MTGFAVAGRPSPLGTVNVELKSVNSRFLDLNLRIADELRAAEQAVRESVSARIARGKVECRIGLRHHASAQAPRVSDQALSQLADLARQVRVALPEAAPLSLADALAWPGVVETADADAELMRQAVLAALSDALDALGQTRRREGEALRSILLQRCAAVEAICNQLQARLPDLQAALERRLTDRLTQALTPALTSSGALSRDDINERIRQEVTLYGLRADVDEELKRLATHVVEVRRLLAAGGAIGRRLDFLMQELNREANTLGSKATAIDLTNAAVELKLAIEQMREQIQNLE